MNLRPPGYEPDELPGCSTPRSNLLRVMVEGGGFEPPKASANRFTVCPVWPLRYPSDPILELADGLEPSTSYLQGRRSAG